MQTTKSVWWNCFDKKCWIHELSCFCMCILTVTEVVYELCLSHNSWHFISPMSSSWSNSHHSMSGSTVDETETEAVHWPCWTGWTWRRGTAHQSGRPPGILGHGLLSGGRDDEEVSGIGRSGKEQLEGGRDSGTCSKEEKGEFLQTMTLVYIRCAMYRSVPSHHLLPWNPSPVWARSSLQPGRSVRSLA